MAEAYIEYRFSISPKIPWEDILLAELQILPFESFMTTKKGLNAYIPAKYHKENILKSIELLNRNEIEIKFTTSKIISQNWNEKWESNFHPTYIGDDCLIRADFHKNKGKTYELIINPKMSFGTGHHPTTHMMLEFVLETSIKGKMILDMGCGTGIIGILALKKGAAQIHAIDNDPWCVENSIENAKKNNCINFLVEKGSSVDKNHPFYDIIFANINRNTLIYQISSYAKALKVGGNLFISGFYEDDKELLFNSCQKENLNLDGTKESKAWYAMKFTK